MSRLLPPVAMAPGNTRAGSAHPRIHTPRHPAPQLEAQRPVDLGLGPLFVHTRDALVVGNIETGRIVLWNPAAERLFGYTAAEAVGQPIDLLIPPPIARLHHYGLANYRRTGQPTILGSDAPMEVPAMTSAGEEIRVELSLVPLEATIGGRRPYMLAMLRDASDRKRAELHALEVARAEAALHDAEGRLRDQSNVFGSGLADLGQPLARLQRSVAHLARLSAGVDDGRGRTALIARVVQRRTDQLHAALRHLADATAMRTGQLELRPERVNLVPLVARVTSQLRQQSTSHKINVALPQGLTASVDEARIEQVLATLLGQAVRRNPRGCWIDVDLRRPLVGLAEIVVRDYGRAVAEPAQQRLLEGNAITLCRWLVAQHGGTLSFEAPAEGGLRAVVTLPTQRGRVSGA